MRSFFKWELVGFVFTVGLGVLLHFLYEWSGESLWVAPFSGVNESTWEHMKLLFFPMFIFAIFERFLFKKVPNFWSIKAKGIIVGLVLVPLLYYFYNGVIGQSPDWINIAIFVICAGVAIAVEIRTYNKKKNKKEPSVEGLVLLISIGIMFVLFTFAPPDIGIFRDPISNQLGIGLY